MDNNDKLKILGQIAVDVPERIGTMYQQVAEFNTLAVQQKNEFESIHSQLRSRVEEVAQELREYLGESRQLQSELALDAESVEESLSAAATQWADDTDEMVTNIEQTRGQIDQLDNAATEAGERVVAMVGEVQNAEQQLEQRLNSSKEQASTGFETLDGSMGSFETALAEVKTASEQTVVALGEKVTAQQEELGDRILDLAKEVGSFVERFEDAVTDIHLNVLTRGVDGMVEAAVNALESEAKEMIRELLSKISDMLKELTDKLTNADGETKAIREAISPLIDELDNLIKPLESLVDAAKAVGSVFGTVASIF